MVFGSSRCLQCSNWWLFLIPLFAIVGIALVFLSTVFNLTISIGTLNELIYVNIVRANTAVFFPPTQAHCCHYSKCLYGLAQPRLKH